ARPRDPRSAFELLEPTAHGGELFGGVDVREARRGAADAAELGLAHVVDVDRGEEVAERITSGEEARLDSGKAAYGVAGVQRRDVAVPARHDGVGGADAPEEVTDYVRVEPR